MMMNRRIWLKSAAGALGGALAWETISGLAQAPARPNILWIVSEDNGPFFGCYGDKFANTPNLNKMAAEGILYENALANAPVCAPARSTIITGVYASSMGTHHMRSGNAIPDRIKLFPQYLRDAGYFTSNRSKTDYNLSPVSKTAWNQIKNGHWKSREAGQPFFSVFNIGTSHESSLHGSKVEEKYLNRDFPLPPYHPDTPEIRSNWVQYYSIITRMDAEVGKILADLEKDGLAEDTIVLYYGDHGGILTRSKRFLFDTGVHVPMLARFPKKFQHLAPGKPGTRIDRMVSFVDLAPTVLSLAGVKVPSYMQGNAFLGEQKTAPPEYGYCFRGRMDECYDMMRAVRDKQYKYIRNYMPHRIYGQHLDYLWKMPATKSWEKEYREGRAKGPQRFFWEPKPTEELYDITKDPWEVANLAGDPKHRDVLERMREANRQHLLRIRDAGFLPESEMIDRAEGSTIQDMARDDAKYPLERLMAAAELAGEREPKALPKLIALMGDRDAGIRYWGATGCAALGAKAGPAEKALTKCLKDETPSVRIAAAEALCSIGKADAALPVLSAAFKENNQRAVLHAVNVLIALGETARPVLPAIQELMKSARDNYVKRAVEHLASTLNA